MRLRTLEWKPFNEMASPAKHHLETRYFHGTSTHKAAKSIITSKKIAVPDLRGRDGSLKPIDGFVYMTPDESYAQIYALGGAIAGTDYFESGRGSKEDPYGFIFVIDNKDLVDIQPDEDSIGELIQTVYEKKPSHWLVKMAKSYLGGRIMANYMSKDELEYDDDGEGGFGDYYHNLTVFDAIIQGEYSAYAIGGKILLKYLSDKQKLDILDLGVHLSNKGSVGFSEVWRLEKSKAKLLKANGSNLEKLVDKDKTGRKFLKDL